MILRFVLDVMSYLHQNNVYNINLKPENILLDERGNFVHRDYLGNFYLEYFENGNQDFLEMNQEVEKRVGIKKDL